MRQGTNQVRIALQAGDKLSSLDAYRRFGLIHLASTIRRLRQEGLPISTTAIQKRNADGRAVRFALYHLAGVEPNVDGG